MSVSRRGLLLSCGLFALACARRAPGASASPPSRPAAPPAVPEPPLDQTPFPPVGDRLVLTPEAWRSRLDPGAYHVLREAGTEPAFTGRYWDDHRAGVYVCRGCGAPLYRSEHKFDSGTGWPSFTQAYEPGRVIEHRDDSYGMVRVELRCARCDGHLGHVFPDGPAPTFTRHCINSASLTLRPRAG